MLMATSRTFGNVRVLYVHPVAAVVKPCILKYTVRDRSLAPFMVVSLPIQAETATSGSHREAWQRRL